MTKMIAHRGACRLAPENTIPAFKKALEYDVDGFENDIHLTKDGVLVVCHNYKVDETSDCSGLISEMTFEELRRCDFGAYFSPEFAGTKIPTLDEFMEVAQNVDLIDIEIKDPKTDNDIVEKAIETIRRFGAEDKTLFSCFNENLLLEAKEREPKIKTALLYDMMTPCITAVYADKIGFAQKYKLDGYHPFVLLVDQNYIDECHANNLFVNVWTVNDKDAMETLVGMGVDGIITDVPEIAKLVDKKGSNQYNI